MLLIAPAFALDLLWQHTKTWKPWQIALVSGFVFVAVMVAVEWPFANYLMTPASANRFFGTGYFDYSSSPLGVDRLREFVHVAQGSALALGLLRASVYGAISTWVGLRFGGCMKEVQR